jgi:hypothetical protein
MGLHGAPAERSNFAQNFSTLRIYVLPLSLYPQSGSHVSNRAAERTVYLHVFARTGNQPRIFILPLAPLSAHRPKITALLNHIQGADDKLGQTIRTHLK